MANYENLKTGIRGAIKENHNNEIDGNLLQQTLLSMVDNLGVGYVYKGKATPSTAPGTPDQNVFYITSTPGTYVNFGGLVVNNGELAILKYSGSWTKDAFNVGGGGGGSVNVIDDLETQSATDALSANMGYRLNRMKALNLQPVTLDADDSWVNASAGIWSIFSRPLDGNDAYDIFFEYPTDFEYAEAVVEFYTGATVPTFYFQDVMWLGGQEPVLQPNKHYVISVVHDLGICAEF